MIINSPLNTDKYVETVDSLINLIKKTNEENERFREALAIISKLPMSESVQNIMKDIAISALKDTE